MDGLTLVSHILMTAIFFGLLLRVMREDWEKNGDFYKKRWADRRKQWASEKNGSK